MAFAEKADVPKETRQKSEFNTEETESHRERLPFSGEMIEGNRVLTQRHSAAKPQPNGRSFRRRRHEKSSRNCAIRRHSTARKMVIAAKSHQKAQKDLRQDLGGTKIRSAFGPHVFELRRDDS